MDGVSDFTPDAVSRAPGTVAEARHCDTRPKLGRFQRAETAQKPWTEADNTPIAVPVVAVEVPRSRAESDRELEGDASATANGIAGSDSPSRNRKSKQAAGKYQPQATEGGGIDKEAETGKGGGGAGGQVLGRSGASWGPPRWGGRPKERVFARHERGGGGAGAGVVEQVGVEGVDVYAVLDFEATCEDRGIDGGR